MDISMYIIIGAGAVALLFAVYGAVRGFYRLTWIGWELLIAYGLDLLIPPQTGIAVSILLLVVFTVLPLAGEYVLRRALFTGRVLGQRTGEKVFNHLFGAVTAVVGALMFLVAVGGIALPAAGLFGGNDFGLPEIITGHALDFFLIAVCLVTLRAGCRLGLLKGLNFLLTLAITFGAFFGFFLLFSQVSGGIAFSTSVGGWFGIGGSAAALLGCMILTLFFTLLAFAGAMILSKFFDGLIRKANSNMAVAIPDALLLGAVYIAVFILALLGIQALFGFMADGHCLSSIVGNIDYVNEMFNVGEIDGTIAEFGEKLSALAQSSPISAGIFRGNPFIA